MTNKTEITGGLKKIEEALKIAAHVARAYWDDDNADFTHVWETNTEALAIIQALRGAVHSDLPDIVKTAQETGWQFESDLGVITTEAAKILNDFVGGGDD